jgi:hypothetical protein
MTKFLDKYHAVPSLHEKVASLLKRVGLGDSGLTRCIRAAGRVEGRAGCAAGAGVEGVEGGGAECGTEAPVLASFMQQADREAVLRKVSTHLFV